MTTAQAWQHPTGPSIGFVAVGRTTFDVASAVPIVRDALDDLRTEAPTVIGDDAILTSAEEVEGVVAGWPDTIATVVVACATFTDSTLPAAATGALGSGAGSLVVLWSFPEPVVGGPLLRNSLCGSILATYRLSTGPVEVRTVHGRPGSARTAGELRAALSARRPDLGGQPSEWIEPIGPTGPALGRPAVDGAEVDRIVAAMARARIGIVGDPPEGFEPCELILEPSPIGARFEHLGIDHLFDTAARHLEPRADGTSVALRSEVAGLVDLELRDQTAVARSLGLHDALRQLADERSWGGVAVRCWPECFTRWGGAACAPLSFLSDAGTPAACEADAYGALTCLLLETVSGRAAFLADLVGIDRDANTCTFWHCGLAPRSMADPNRPIAAIDHQNRGTPLVLHFGLAPGPVTLCRISQSGRRLRLVVGAGEVVEGPAPFVGTSGTVLVDSPVDDLLGLLSTEGLEHHLAIVPGDHRAVLAAVAERWDLPLLTITD